MGVKYVSKGDSSQGGREENQDAHKNDDEHLIYIVADGISSCRQSRQGSQNAVDTALKWLIDNIKNSNALFLLHRAIQNANRAVYDLNVAKDATGAQRIAKKAETTMDIAMIRNNTLYFAHAGDGRIYLFDKKKKLHLATTDHVSGDGTITARLGASKKLENTQVDEIPLSGYSRILLATDGIHKMISDKELSDILAKSAPQETVLDLIFHSAKNPVSKAHEYMKERNMTFAEAQQIIGGSDNMTAILIDRQED